MKTILILTGLISCAAQLSYGEMRVVEGQEGLDIFFKTVVGSVESSTSSYWDDEEDEPAFSSMTVTGWHCVEFSTPSYVDLDCHTSWINFNERSRALTEHCKPHEPCFVPAIYIPPPQCEDKEIKSCIREVGYRSDGTVVWREP